MVAHDVRHAIRLLVKRPGFAALAILTLALGVGATTAIFTVVDAILLRPLPFAEPDRLVQVHIRGGDGNRYPLPDADYLAWRSLNRTADAVAVWESGKATLTGAGPAEEIGAAGVTDRFFAVLGARPLLGRVFQQGDDAAGAAPVVVLSHGFWARRFNSDPAIVGRSLALGGLSHTIVGVMPAGFRFPLDDIDVWQNLEMKPPSRRGPFYTTGLARLKSGATLDELRANLRSVAASLKRQYPAPEDWTLEALPLRESLVGNVRRTLYVLFGAVGFLLLIATVNVANLLLARATTREREIALRGALGAGRGRIVAQLLTESLVLSILAGTVGLALASWGTRVLIALAPDGIPRLDEVRMNMPVFVFALAIASASGLLFGLVPALRAARSSLVSTLKEGGRGGLGARQRRVQRTLVVVEVALALVLSVGAGLMIRSLAALQRVSPGFDATHLLTFEIALPRTLYPEEQNVRAFYDRLLERLEAIPGVRSAGLSISLPPATLQVTDNFMVEGQTLPPNQSAPVAPLVMASDHFFATLGVPLVRGRLFDARDAPDAPPVVIVNEALARKYYPGVDPIGRRFKIGGPERPVAANNPWRTVVGVVGDVKYSGLDTPPEPTFYTPFRQITWRGQFVSVRATADPRQLAASAQAVVASLDPNIPVANVRTMDQLMAASVAPPRFRTTLVSAFAFVGLLLAAIGIYGVMASAVADRTYELGVRMALGADRSTVLRMVMGEAAVLAAIGVAVGSLGAFPAARVIQSLLFGVAASDTLTFAVTSVVLVAAALAASYVPARRAMRIDPMAALRAE